MNNEEKNVPERRGEFDKYPTVPVFLCKAFVMKVKQIRQSDIVRKRNTQKRYEKVRERCNELYNEQRIRWDDVIETLSEEFGISPATIERKILKSD
ncbi:MAG: hypothetical protein Roseis2KO_27510 [Roseivirga sp.]